MQLIDEALALTRRMLAGGERGAWDEVIELERQRRQQLGQLFAAPGALDETTAERVRELLRLDRELIALGVRMRDGVAAELGEAQLGRKVARAYHASSR